MKTNKHRTETDGAGKRDVLFTLNVHLYHSVCLYRGSRAPPWSYSWLMGFRRELEISENTTTDKVGGFGLIFCRVLSINFLFVPEHLQNPGILEKRKY